MKPKRISTSIITIYDPIPNYGIRDVKAAAKELCRLYTDEELYGTLVRGCEASAQKYSADVVLGRFAEMAFDDKNGLKTRGLE